MKKITKIGQYLCELSKNKSVSFFMAHSVYISSCWSRVLDLAGYTRLFGPRLILVSCPVV